MSMTQYDVSMVMNNDQMSLCNGFTGATIMGLQIIQHYLSLLHTHAQGTDTGTDGWMD